MRTFPHHARILRFARRSGRAAWRTACLFADSTATTAAYLASAAPRRFEPHHGARWTQIWARRLAHRFGLRMEISGRLPDQGALLVANHRSYVDIPALGSLTPACFIAKADIQRWPLLGLTFRVSPTLFVDRSNPTARLQLRNAARARLEAGVSILNFPEGTTQDGPGLLPFKMGLFKEIFSLDLPVVPITITYTGMDRRVEWVGDDTFLDHLLRLAGHDGLTAHVHILEPINTRDFHSVSDLTAELRRRMLLDLAGRESGPGQGIPHTPDAADPLAEKRP